MENLKNSPLLKVLSHKHEHFSRIKGKGYSKLSLRRNEVRKSKPRDVHSKHNLGLPSNVDTELETRVQILCNSPFDRSEHRKTENSHDISVTNDISIKVAKNDCKNIAISSSESSSELKNFDEKSTSFGHFNSSFNNINNEYSINNQVSKQSSFSKNLINSDNLETFELISKEKLFSSDIPRKSSIVDSDADDLNEICTEFDELAIVFESNLMLKPTVPSQHPVHFESATAEDDSNKRFPPLRIFGENKENESSKSEVFNTNSTKKVQILQDILSSDEDSPLPLVKRIAANTIAKPMYETTHTKLHIKSYSSSSSSDEFEEFLYKLKTPVSKTKVPSNEETEILANGIKTDMPTKNTVTTQCIVKSKTAIENLGTSPAFPIQAFPSKKFHLKNEKRRMKISFSSDDENICDEVFPPLVNKVSTSKGSEEIKSSKNSATKCSFLASLSTNVPESKADPEALIYRKHFESKKDELLKKLFILYNSKAFNNQLPQDMKITWNSRMRKTAGFCYYKKDNSCPLGRSARIELAPKVVDRPDRLRDTLVHELCHAAAWLIHGYRDGHGSIWKFWACRVQQTFPELPSVSRCHSYDITTKYVYKCSGCGGQIGRHSKSIDINRQICGRCGSKFELFVNGKHSNSSSAPTGFALFVKENYGKVKKNHDSIKHAEIMKILSNQFSSKAKIS